MGGYSFTGEEGALNIRAGFKLDALDQNGLVPGLAVVPEVIIPTGDEDVASDELEGEIRSAGAMCLARTYRLAAMQIRRATAVVKR